MKAVDTSIIVRTLLRDDPVQSPIAARLMAERVFIPLTVLQEVGWVLRSRYRLPHAMIADTLGDLVDTHSVADVPFIRRAIARYRAGADLADMLHLAASRNTDGFATFDRALAAEAGDGAPVAVEVVGP